MKTLLFNAHIYAHPDDTALLINDARIEKTGTLETLQNESDECVDAKGAWIYPGFHGFAPSSDHDRTGTQLRAAPER